MTDHAELRRLLDEATPGPWEYLSIGPDDSYRVVAKAWGVAAACDYKDARLIVAAVNAIPALLDELDRLQATLAGVRALPGEWRNQEVPDTASAVAHNYAKRLCAAELQAKLGEG